MRASLSLKPSCHELGSHHCFLSATTITGVVIVSSGASQIQQSRFTRLHGHHHLYGSSLGNNSSASAREGYHLFEFGLGHRWPRLYKSGATRLLRHGVAQINNNLDGGRFSFQLDSVKKEGGDDSKCSDSRCLAGSSLLVSAAFKQA